MKAEFVAVKGRTYNKPFQLDEGSKVTVGRGDDCDIQVLDAGLSRRQCELEMQQGQFVLRDSNSRNGTWVNGVRIKETFLRDGDRVRLGGIEFVFRTLAERRHTPANLVAAVPEDSTYELKEKLDPHRTSLMNLPHEFQTLENFRRVQRDLSTIYEVGNLIHAERDPNTLYQRIAAAILDFISADRCVLLLHNPAAGQPHEPLLQTAAFRTVSETPSGEFAFSRTVAEEAFASGMSILRSNVLDDEHFAAAESVIRDNITSVMCVPVESPDGIHGVLYADTLGHTQGFRKHDLELLAAVGRQAGIAIGRMQLQEELRRSFFGTVRALVDSVEAKDEYTRGHSERVTSYALQIGGRMGLSTAEMQTLELACLLHDVGKIGVMESLLIKPGALTPDERRIMQRHPDIGANIIRNIERSERICQIVRYHHERWDGKGYPKGLQGDSIPLSSRILTVADTLDAMTSERPYRKTPGFEEVVRTLQQEGGRQFDAEVSRVAAEMLLHGEIKLDGNSMEPTSFTGAPDEGSQKASPSH